MPTEIADDAEPNTHERELGELLATVDVSAPSVSKFNGVRTWLAGTIKVEPRQIGVYYVSQPGNLKVRLRQPGVKSNAPRLAVALIPAEHRPDGYLKAARGLVEAGEFEAIAICRGSKSNWRGVATLKIEGSDLDPTLDGLIGDVIPIAKSPVSSRPNPGAPSPSVPSIPYDIARFCEETGLSEATARDWLERLLRKGQMIIQGPPGTGKTWVAERLALLVVGAGKGAVDTVQFHPAWTYEDFVAGIAPTIRDGLLAYEAKAGRFIDFCEVAMEAGGDPSALVLDEFNRADVPRVFGELMHLLEYRGKELLLPFGPNDGRFAVPGNVFLIATMNTADRSAVQLDHALRRRFSFVRLRPNYDLLRAKLAAVGLDPEPLIETLTDLNAEIADPDFEIGISFFLAPGKDLGRLLPSIWDGEVEPYVRDILHSRPDAADRWSWAGVKPRFAAWE